MGYFMSVKVILDLLLGWYGEKVYLCKGIEVEWRIGQEGAVM